MAAKRGKKDKLTNKTPEVTLVDEQLKEKELITGKAFYESDWLRIQEKERSDCFIRGIIDETFEISFAEWHHKSCDIQSLPYSVQWAKKRIIEVVECYFLKHDSGQSAEKDYMWLEDAEPPLPAVIDSWARGMMPIETDYIITETDKEDVTEAKVEEDEEEQEEITMEPLDLTETKVLSRESDKDLSHFKKERGRPKAHKQRDKPPPMIVLDTLPENHDTPLTSQSSISQVRSHTPPTPTALLAISPIVTIPCDSTHKRMSAVTNKGGTVKVKRNFDSKKFPSPSIKPHVKISQVPKTVMLHETNIKTGLPTDNNKYQYHQIHHKRQTNVNLACSHQHKPGTTTGLQRIDSSRFPRRPVLPFIVDLIDPAPGVTVKAQGCSLTSCSRITTRLPPTHGHLKPIKPQKVISEEKEDNKTSLLAKV